MLCLKITGWVANSADPDETPHSAALYLDLHCLLRPIWPNTVAWDNSFRHKLMCINEAVLFMIV